MIAYKLFRKRKDGSLGSLFINRAEKLNKGIELPAKSYPTKGYKYRPKWHCLAKPEAPHLSKKGRIWYKVFMEEYERIERPPSQGGVWFLAGKITILEPL